MLNEIIIKTIQLVHICIILFVLIIPFTNSPYLLLLHGVFIPFMILHWVTNNNTCVLTTAEKYVRRTKTKQDENDCFTCRLINPIFDFRKKHVQFSEFIYIITISMWLVSILKLSLKWKSGEIKNLFDLFQIKPVK